MEMERNRKVITKGIFPNTVVNDVFVSKTRYIILKHLLNYGPKKREKLSKELRMSSTTLYDNLTELMKGSMVSNFKLYSKRKGRSNVVWKAEKYYDRTFRGD